MMPSKKRDENLREILIEQKNFFRQQYKVIQQLQKEHQKETQNLQKVLSYLFIYFRQLFIFLNHFFFLKKNKQQQSKFNEVTQKQQKELDEFLKNSKMELENTQNSASNSEWNLEKKLVSEAESFQKDYQDKMKSEIKKTLKEKKKTAKILLKGENEGDMEEWLKKEEEKFYSELQKKSEKSERGFQAKQLEERQAAETKHLEQVFNFDYYYYY